MVGHDVEDNPLQEAKVRDLGDEVAEVLFQWTQRGRIRSEGEVQLLGRLLSTALFPQQINRRLLEASLADEVLVRLRVDGATLVDVPWELATVPGRGIRFLAATPKYRFVRMVPSEALVVPTSKSASILSIVVQKEDPDRAPVAFDAGRQVLWPPVKTIVNDLTIAMDRPPFRLISLTNPQPIKADKQLTETRSPLDIVHYIGYGRFHEQRQEPELAFSDGAGGVRFTAAKELFSLVAASGARLLVIKFATPPHDLEIEPLPLSALLEALQGRVMALLCTRVPVHALQLKEFNEEFYGALAKSESIEAAVQAARYRLRRNTPLDDHAAFGGTGRACAH